jgi:hypothetical protein
MLIVSQGAMAFGGLIWGLSGQVAGTRPTLLGAALLFFTATVAWPILWRRSSVSLALNANSEGPRPSAI